MKRKAPLLFLLSSVLALLLCLGTAYLYVEPQSPFGILMLPLHTRSSDQDLAGLSRYLWKVNGGYLPASYEEALLERLDLAEPESPEYEQILGFFAQQNYSSRSGERICTAGKPYLEDILNLGRSANTAQRQQAFLMLAISVQLGRSLYKPFLDPSQDIVPLFDLVQRGELGAIPISEP